MHTKHCCVWHVWTHTHTHIKQLYNFHGITLIRRRALWAWAGGNKSRWLWPKRNMDFIPHHPAHAILHSPQRRCLSVNSVGMSVNTPRIEKGVTEKKTSKRTRGQLRDQSTRGGGEGGHSRRLL